MKLSHAQIYITLQCGPAWHRSQLNVISFKVNSHRAFASGALIWERPWLGQRRWCNLRVGVALGLKLDRLPRDIEPSRGWWARLGGGDVIRAPPEPRLCFRQAAKEQPRRCGQELRPRWINLDAKGPEHRWEVLVFHRCSPALFEYQVQQLFYLGMYWYQYQYRVLVPISMQVLVSSLIPKTGIGYRYRYQYQYWVSVLIMGLSMLLVTRRVKYVQKPQRICKCMRFC